MNGSGAARRVLVCVMTPPGGVVAHLIEPARLRPYSSMPPWRGEGMTGTRALGLPTASGCWRWSCHPPQLSTEGVQQLS